MGRVRRRLGLRRGRLTRQNLSIPVHAVDECAEDGENHAAAVAPYFMWYKFGRVHQTLRVTSAMIAGVADHVWTAQEIVTLLDR